MNGRVAIAVVAGLGLAYGIANYGLDYWFPSPERIAADIPVDETGQGAGNGQTAPDREADRSGAATRRARDDGTLRPEHSGFPSAEIDMITWEEEDRALPEGDDYLDPDQEWLLQEIAEDEEELRRKFQDYPDLAPLNLSDEEILAELEAAIAEAHVALESSEQ